MPGALDALLSLDTASLDVRLDVARGAKDASATVSLRDFDPRSLLGDLGTLLQDVESLPSDPQAIADLLLKGLGELDGLVDFSNLGVAGDAARILTELTNLVRPIAERLGSSPQQLVDSILDGYGGLQGLIAEVASRFTESFSETVPEVIRAPLAAIQQLARQKPQSGEELAAFLSQFILGLDLGAVKAPSRLLEELRGRLAAAGGDLEPIRRGVTSLTAQIDAATASLTQPTVSLTAVAQLVVRARRDLQGLTNELLPGAAAAFLDDLEAIDADGWAQRLDGALRPLVARVPEPPAGLASYFVEPLRELADAIDSFTAETITQKLAEAEARFRDAIRESDVGSLLASASSLVDGLRNYLQRVPLADLRAELRDALLDVETRIRSLGAFSPVHELSEHLRAIESAIDGIDLSRIQDRIQELKDQIQEVFDAFPIDDIRSELDSLIATAADAVAGIGPALENVSQQIDSLADRVTSFELDAAGEASVTLLADVRKNIRDAVSSADLPDVARTALGALAGEVKKIDVTAELSGPFDEAMGRLDVGALFAPLESAIEDARTSLRKLTPSALIEELDKPFLELLQILERVNPNVLVAQLSTEFQRFLSLVDRIDPRTAIAPIQAEFDRLVSELRRAADPAPLFQPLKDAYAELQSLIDLIDPAPVLAKVLARVSQLPDAVGGAAREQLATRFGEGQSLPAISGTGAFRFGDILRPFALLLAEVRARVLATAGSVVNEGLDQISRPLQELSSITAAGGNLLFRLGETLEERISLLDVEAPSGPMAELRDAIERLTHVEASLAASGRSNVELGQAVLSLRLNVQVSGSAVPRGELREATDRLAASVQPRSVTDRLKRLGSALPEFIPTSLALPGTTSTALEKIEALFDAVDPMPLVTELDALGERIQRKLQSFAREIGLALIHLWNAVIDALMPALPQGIIPALQAAMTELRNELASLDPAQIEAEIGRLLDAVVDMLGAYSPAAFAAELGETVDHVKAKLQSLDPATLLGDLDPVGDLIDEFKSLRPSLVLAPLLSQTEALEDTLLQVLDFDPGEILIQAVAKLRVELEEIIAAIEAEIDGLLDDLGAGSGAAEISVSASANVG